MSNNKDIKPTTSRKNRGKTNPCVIMPAPDTLAAMPEGYLSLLTGLFLFPRAAWEQRHSALRCIPMVRTSAFPRGAWEREQTLFPDMTGFLPRNLKYMRTFAQAWPDRAIVQRTVAQLPWRSNLTLFSCSHAPRGNKDTARCAVYRRRGHLHYHAARGNESNLREAEL